MIKKLTSIILILLIIAIFPIVIQAETNLPFVDKDFAALLDEQITSEFKETIMSQAQELVELENTDIPIVEIYGWSYLSEFSTTNNNVSLLSVKEKFDNYTKDYDIVLLGNESIVLHKIEFENEIIVTNTPENIVFSPNEATFINDIRSMKRTVVILNTQCTIEKILCFFSKRAGTVVGIITDKGNFIKYYGVYNQEGTIFKEEEFNMWAKECMEYTIELNKITLSSGNCNLLRYIEQKNNGTLKDLDELRSEISNTQSNSTLIEEFDKTNHEVSDRGISPWVWVAVVSGSVAVVGAAVLAAVLIPRRKKRKNSTE